MKMLHRFLLLAFISVIPMFVGAQTSFKIHAGVGYLEHTSLGAGLVFNHKHDVSFLYGSNLLVRPGDFSLYLLQYQRALPKLSVSRFAFHVGVKSGYGLYSDRYYRWKLLCGTAYLGSAYALGSRTSLFADGGVIYSRVLEVTRKEQGAIGWYREWLPEFKIGISFTI